MVAGVLGVAGGVRRPFFLLRHHQHNLVTDTKVHALGRGHPDRDEAKALLEMYTYKRNVVILVLGCILGGLITAFLGLQPGKYKQPQTVQ